MSPQTAPFKCTARTDRARLRERWCQPWVATMLALLAAACTSHPRRSEPPLPPPRDAEFLPGDGGERLYIAIAGAESARAVVWYVVGSEVGSGALYPQLSQALHQAGIATAVLHPRGTGYSSGLRGDVADYRRVLGDYDAFHRHLQDRFRGRPLFLLGHSAGAAFALHVAAEAHAGIAGLVLVNPAYKLRYAKGMGPSAADYIVYAGNYVFRPSALTVDMNRDPAAIGDAADRAEGFAMQRDPLVVRYFSLRYMFAQKQVMDRCAAHIAATDAPLLLLQGAHDALVDPAGTDQLFAAARTHDKTRLIADGAGHGSTAVETQVPALLDWLNRHIPATTSPPDLAH